MTRYFLETGVAKFTILDFSHADFGFFTCMFCGFGFSKTDYDSVSWLRSCTFFSAFVLFFIWISPNFGFEVVTHASPHRINFKISSSEFWLFLEGVSAVLPHQLNVFIRAQCVSAAL